VPLRRMYKTTPNDHISADVPYLDGDVYDDYYNDDYDIYEYLPVPVTELLRLKTSGAKY
jgi:hypothetical protein